MWKLTVVVAYLFAMGCGGAMSPGPATSTGGASASGGASATGGAPGAGGSPMPGSTTFAGTWMYVAADGQTGLGLATTGDGRFEMDFLALTSPTTANDERLVGTYVADASMITFTASQWSCDGHAPVLTDSYRILSGTLHLQTPAAEFVMPPAASPTPSSFFLTFGCADASGNFTPHPLGPAQ